MGEFSIMHWLVVFIILLLFFGPSKLPQLGKSLGEAIRDFKKGINEVDSQKPEVRSISHQEVPKISAVAQSTEETEHEKEKDKKV